MSTVGRRTIANWRSYPANYRRFCAITFVAGVGYGFVDLLVPLYGDALGASNLTIGFLFAVFSLPKAVVSPVVGALSDAVGHRRDVVATGFIAAGVLYALIPVLGFVAAFLALRALLGGVDAAIRPTARTLISEVGGEDSRGASFGLYSSFRTFGTVVGPVAIGVVIARSGYLVSFGLTGLAFVLAGVLTHLLIDRDFGPAHEGRSLSGVVGRFRARGGRPALRRPSAGMAVVYAIVFLRFVGLHAYVRFLPLYLASVGFTTGVVGALFAVRTLSAALLFPAGGAASDRFGRLSVLAAGVALSALAPLVLFASPALPVVVAGLLIAGVGRALFIPTLPAYLSDVTEQTDRGSRLGGVSAVSSLAVGTAPVAAGTIGDAVGVGAILLFSGAVLSAGVALFGLLWLVRR